MKKLTLLAVFGILTINTFAQKLGHINSGEVLQLLMTEEGIIKKLEDKKIIYQDLLIKSKTTFDNDVKDYQDNIDKYTDSDREMIEQELVEAQQKLMKTEKLYNEKIQEYQQSLINPLEEKVIKSISIIAEKGKYTYIFDSSVGVLLYFKESEDITNKVKEELGL
jgi:outer membrane protein